MVSTSGMIDADEFCASENPAELLGRQIETTAGVGTVVRKPAGLFVEVELQCARDECPARKTFYLSCGAPGLCYVHDPDTGAYLADLRNDQFVCEVHHKA